jgi:hypothetical protein
MANSIPAIWVYKNGATHKMPATRAAKLVKALRENQAGEMLADLVANGYDEFLGVDGDAYCVDGMTLELIGVAG